MSADQIRELSRPVTNPNVVVCPCTCRYEFTGEALEYYSWKPCADCRGKPDEAHRMMLAAAKSEMRERIAAKKHRWPPTADCVAETLERLQ